MAHFKIHKFNTKQIADDAMELLNVEHGLPVEDGITKFDNSSYQQHEDGYYFIAYDAEWTSCLGEPIEIAPINNEI